MAKLSDYQMMILLSNVLDFEIDSDPVKDKVVEIMSTLEKEGGKRFALEVAFRLAISTIVSSKETFKSMVQDGVIKEHEASLMKRKRGILQ